MSNGRNKIGKKRDSGRDAGGFIALPWQVTDSAPYARLSHPARGLLIEIARQFVHDNNGRLLCSFAYLSKRGWTSSDVILRAKRELLAAGFIHETVKGQRPNKASWYAITWQAIDRLPGYDVGAVETFERGAYRKTESLKIKSLCLPDGVEGPLIGPSGGVGNTSAVPPHGPIDPTFDTLSTPSGEHHLDMPSPAVVLQSAAMSGDVGSMGTESARATLADPVLQPVKTVSTEPVPVAKLQRLEVARLAQSEAAERMAKRPTLKLKKAPVADGEITRVRDCEPEPENWEAA